jgi:predicted ATPase
MGGAREGTAEKRAQGTLLNLPFFLALMAECCEAAGRTNEAEALLAEALDLTEATDERWFEAELHRLRGDCRLARRTAEPSEAEACYRQALTIGRCQGARQWELRARNPAGRTRDTAGYRAPWRGRHNRAQPGGAWSTGSRPYPAHPGPGAHIDNFINVIYVTLRCA